MNKETKYPYVLFHINGSLYCLNSQYLSKIRPMPDYEKIPKAPARIHISVPLDAGITISTQTIRPWHSICAK